MVEDAAPAADSGRHCPWCSAALPSDNEPNCPSCGAVLVGDADPSVPGVTALDAEAIIRNARNATPQRRNRLLSWISGDYDEGSEAPAAPGSLSLPPEDVRREMLRLELEAEVANLQAEAESLVSEAEVEAREEGWEPGDEPVAADATTDAVVEAARDEEVADDGPAGERTEESSRT
jgi:hypothetical protein